MQRRCPWADALGGKRVQVVTRGAAMPAKTAPETFCVRVHVTDIMLQTLRKQSAVRVKLSSETYFDTPVFDLTTSGCSLCLHSPVVMPRNPTVGNVHYERLADQKWIFRAETGVDAGTAWQQVSGKDDILRALKRCAATIDGVPMVLQDETCLIRVFPRMVRSVWTARLEYEMYTFTFTGHLRMRNGLVDPSCAIYATCSFDAAAHELPAKLARMADEFGDTVFAPDHALVAMAFDQPDLFAALFRRVAGDLTMLMDVDSSSRFHQLDAYCGLVESIQRGALMVSDDDDDDDDDDNDDAADDADDADDAADAADDDDGKQS